MIFNTIIVKTQIREKEQYENVYTNNGESYNPNIETLYLRARYYSVVTANFLTEDNYLGNINEPLTLNRYSYCLASPLNYVDPSGHWSFQQLEEKAAEFSDKLRELTDSLKYGIEYSLVSAAKPALETVGSVVKYLEENLNRNNEFYTTFSHATVEASMIIDSYLESQMNQAENMGAFYVGRCLTDAAIFVGGVAMTVKGILEMTGGGIGTGAAVGSVVATITITITGVGAVEVAGGLVVSVTAGKNFFNSLDEAVSYFNSNGNIESKYKPGDKTPKGREYTKHGAEHANERGFDFQKIDSIIDNNYKHRVKEIDDLTGEVTWRYQDKRGNTVVTNEFGDKIVTVYSYPESANGGNYIPKN